MVIRQLQIILAYIIQVSEVIVIRQLQVILAYIIQVSEVMVNWSSDSCRSYWPTSYRSVRSWLSATDHPGLQHSVYGHTTSKGYTNLHHTVQVSKVIKYIKTT